MVVTIVAVVITFLFTDRVHNVEDLSLIEVMWFNNTPAISIVLIVLLCLLVGLLGVILLVGVLTYLSIRQQGESHPETLKAIRKWHGL